MIDVHDTIVIGRHAKATESNEIVLAAGPDNQLRFKADGRVLHNGRLLATNVEITDTMLEILRDCR